MHDKPRPNIMLNSESLKAFSQRSGTRQGCQMSYWFNIVLARATRQDNEMKSILNRKEGIKVLNFFAEDIFFFVQKNSQIQLKTWIN